MKLVAVRAAFFATFIFSVSAAPAANDAAYYTLTTQTDRGCVFYTYGTNTQTETVPAATTTITVDSTTTLQTTSFVLPTEAPKRKDGDPTDVDWTIGVTVVCANTQTVDPTITTTETNIVETSTAFASTETQVVETYTMCIEGHWCL